MKILLSLIGWIGISLNVCLGLDFHELEKLSFNSLDDWFVQVNQQYEILNQFSASFTWDLIVNPTASIYDEATKFGGTRSQWRNIRCSEAEQFHEEMTPVQKRMIWIFCRGPKYTDFQGSELSSLLTKIQNIYTGTEICLPKSFDLCLNSDRIWDFTYIKTPNDDVYAMDMTSVAPSPIDGNLLHFFDGKVSPNYYVFRGVDSSDPPIEEKQTELAIRQSEMFCLDIDSGLEKIMSGNFSSLRRMDCALPTDSVLHWAWEAWRLAVGPEIQKYYFNAIYFMNLGAQNNGYNDIGETWREELEMPNLRGTVEKLWKRIKPYYKLLHGVLRNALWKKYDGSEGISKTGTLPAHLLGNMWSQDWSAYYKLLVPLSTVDIDENFINTNWTILDMVTRSEDFYSSMGINPMTKKFWENSQFNKSSNKTKCHGSAGNMYKDDDYRMIVCPEKTLNDFYVIVHEMGHIQYYMHVNSQPPLFQDATNSAFGEAIGDTIFMATMTPQHLNRLGLLSDKFLIPENLSNFEINHMRIIHELAPPAEFNNVPLSIHKSNNPQNPFIDQSSAITLLDEPFPNFEELNLKMRNFMNLKKEYDHSMNSFDLSLLLRMALSKLPQIPFGLILDKWRWDLFDGKVPFDQANDQFWKLSIFEQGIHPPQWKNRHDFFDAASKFHIADNTPYVRYFLSSFLEAQIFKGLCEKTIFDRLNTGQKLPMPLHRCDIYGSKRAGRLLRKAMSFGSSVHWSEILFILTGTREISVEPLIEYYKPLFIWMEKLVIEYDIPIGWN